MRAYQTFTIQLLLDQIRVSLFEAITDFEYISQCFPQYTIEEVQAHLEAHIYEELN